MPTKTRKRKASEEEAAEVEEVSQPGKKPVRKTQRKPRATQGQPPKRGGSSKRIGLSSSATGNASKKSKPASSSARGAKSDIRRDADDMIVYIDSRYSTNTECGTVKNNSLSSKITSILQEDLDTRNIVYQKSHNCIKALQEAIDEYEAVNRDSLNIGKPTEGAQWDQDAKDVAKVDKKAMEILIQTLNGLIISGGYSNSLRSPPRSSDDVEQAAWLWVEGGIPEAEDTWGSSARETLKAFGGIAKLLL